MRLVPRRWSNETWICSLREHVLPAANVSRLRPEDAALGRDTTDGRLCRCLRCDAWILVAAPTRSGSEVLPPRDRLPRPRRGRPLEDAILLRVIALERAFHSLLFGLVSVGVVVTELGQPWLQEQLQHVVDQTSRRASQSWLIEELSRLADVETSTLLVVLSISLAYCLLEGVEAIGLWMERRWAEYLTVVATVGFLPLEIRELAEKVSPLRVGALTVNLAILVYLVWSKRLFGLRGGAAAARRASEEAVDWGRLLEQAPVRPAPPGSPGAR